MMIVLVANDMQHYQPIHKLAYNLQTCWNGKTIPGMESE
jgi:hypothetical protein